MKAVNIILFLLLSLTNNLFSQADMTLSQQKSLEKDEFEILQKQLDYSKTKRTLVPREQKTKKRKKEKDMPSFALPGLGSGLSILAYAIVIILIGFLLYFIFSNIKLDQKIEASSEIDIEEIENIEELDTRIAYEEAIRNEDYRSAIRMQFLYVMQILSLKELIVWKPEKTNRDYNREIDDIEIKNEFRQLASYFERIWYGNNIIDEQRFNSLNAFYINFIKKHNVK